MSASNDRQRSQRAHDSASLQGPRPGPSGSLTKRSQRATFLRMIEIRKTAAFVRWLDRLKDLRARARVQVRIERLAQGHPGDVKPVGEGVSEMRIDCGPGYRVYFVKQGHEIIVLLAGGSKRTQVSDIRKAIELARNL